MRYLLGTLFARIVVSGRDRHACYTLLFPYSSNSKALASAMLLSLEKSLTKTDVDAAQVPHVFCVHMYTK